MPQPIDKVTADAMEHDIEQAFTGKPSDWIIERAANVFKEAMKKAPPGLEELQKAELAHAFLSQAIIDFLDHQCKINPDNFPKP